MLCYRYPQFPLRYYLLPKWYGSDGDSKIFAKWAADSLGGDRGNILYFLIASGLITRTNGEYGNYGLDWLRIQQGYRALVMKYGANNGAKNQFAYMACKFIDRTTAREQFSAIGEEWTRTVWGDRKIYDEYRDWAKAHD